MSPAPVTSSAASAKVQRLPVTISPVSTPEQLAQVLALRQKGYGKHYAPEVRVWAGQPDEIDLAGNSTTLVAVDKVTKAVVGTIRLSLSLDVDVPWPEGMPAEECLSGVYSYVDRLTVDDAYPDASLVAAALMKAGHLWTLVRDAEWATALALAPLVRYYKHRCGMDVRADGKGFTLPAYSTKHDFYLVAVRIHEMRAKIAQYNPEFSQMFFNKVHPDINVHGAGIPWQALARQPARLELVANS